MGHGVLRGAVPLGGGPRRVERGGQSRPIAVVPGEDLRGDLAHVPDAEGEDRLRERLTSRPLDRGEEVRGGLLAPPFQMTHLLGASGAMPLRQGEDVRRGPQPTELMEAFHLLLAQTFDVQGGSRDEMLEPGDPLRRTDQAAGAAAHALPRLAHGGAVAFGAPLGHDPGNGVGGAGRQVDGGDLRDDVARAIDLDPVARPHVAPVRVRPPVAPRIIARADRDAAGIDAGDVVLVVKGRVRHDDAADRHRLEPRDGGEGAGPAHVDLDIA